MKILLFVYGTLKRGQRAHPLLAGQEFRGEAQTFPRYRLYDAGPYPLLVEEPADGVAVQGEVWSIDDALLPLLNQYEGAPCLFHRQLIGLENMTEPVWAYFYQGSMAGASDCGGRWPPNR